MQQTFLNLAQQTPAMRVKVPDGVQGGQAFQVRTPSGTLVTVTAPLGLQPGQWFQFVVMPPPMPPPKLSKPPKPPKRARGEAA